MAAAHWSARVVSNHSLTPHMRRVIVGAPELAGFPQDQESGYVKVAFEGEAGPLVRSYTVRAFEPESCQLTLDFVDHGDTGPASRWARRAVAGDPVAFRGPGERKLADPTADWFLLAADMSALPALSVNLEKLPAGARGAAFIEVLSEDDIQPLVYPEGIEVRWLVNPDNERENTVLADAVRAAPWLAGTPYPWFAGEFETMRNLRRYFRDERGIDRKAMYLSSYWKIGATDEGMKAAKRADPEAA